MVLETANERRLTPAVVTPLASYPNVASAAEAAGSTQTPRGDLLASLTADAGLDDFIEAMVEWSHRMLGTDEIVFAREQFDADTGKVFHDDHFYGVRTSYFFDHFLFERPVPTSRTGNAEPVTPYSMFLAYVQQHAAKLPPGLAERVASLGAYRHSIFVIQRVSERTLLLQDLLRGDRLTVAAKPNETFRAIEKKTMMQTFVFDHAGTMQLSHGIILHPQKANRVLKRFIKIAKKSETLSTYALFCRCACVQLRHLRHRHVEPKAIYQTELK